MISSSAGTRLGRVICRPLLRLSCSFRYFHLVPPFFPAAIHSEGYVEDTHIRALYAFHLMKGKTAPESVLTS